MTCTSRRAGPALSTCSAATSPATAGIGVVGAGRDLLRLVHAMRRLAETPVPIVDLDGHGCCGLCDAVLPDFFEEWGRLGWHTTDCPLRIAKEIFS